MRRNGWALLWLVCTSASAMADFTEDFQCALTQYHAGKHADACQQFTALAAKAPHPGSKSDALRYAVLSAIRTKRFDQAEQLLEQIPRESTRNLCRMDLLLAQGQAQQLVRRFQDDDLTEWSDFHIYDALLARGQAYRRLQRYHEALADFKRAEELVVVPIKQAHLLNLTGATLEEAGDDDRALDVYRRMQEIAALKGYGIINDATLRAARLLAKRGKHADALKEIDQIPPTPAGYWHTQPLLVRAEILAAGGRKAEAAACYREALQGAPDAMRRSIQAALDQLK